MEYHSHKLCPYLQVQQFMLPIASYIHCLYRGVYGMNTTMQPNIKIWFAYNIVIILIISLAQLLYCCAFYFFRIAQLYSKHNQITRFHTHWLWLDLWHCIYLKSLHFFQLPYTKIRNLHHAPTFQLDMCGSQHWSNNFLKKPHKINTPLTKTPQVTHTVQYLIWLHFWRLAIKYVPIRFDTYNIRISNTCTLSTYTGLIPLSIILIVL